MANPMRMHVARTPSKYVDKVGNVRRYESVLVRCSYREGNKVRHETLANLANLRWTGWPGVRTRSNVNSPLNTLDLK
jgi:hypothetical protein